MTTDRDNFTSKTIDILAKRVSYKCSNPKCKKNTVGPNHSKHKATIVGVAAHITAASPGGPRYNQNLTTEERRDIDNGIWLCVNCSTLIDKDPISYPTKLLEEWKKEAEDETNELLLGNHNKKERPLIEADLIWSNSQRWNKGYSSKNKELYGNTIVIGQDKPIIFWNLVWNFKIALYNNSRFPAFNIKVEQIGINKFDYIGELPLINNLPPYKNIELQARFEKFIEGTGTEADKSLNQKVPEALKNLKLKITYNDEEGNEHTTVATIDNEMFVNKRE
ncbi:hypothetical protein [Chryseobacterium sp. JV274]|uniref:hypothetical protein n=1 Tax=Chryseobacterium sp. JV274 TaxID=1932669 RepID=UPI0015C20BC2|nr:hypothetical protein [Chryseobacterium sp. JV274]CAD0221302.1 conserved protein of unknown function [Chryseobacterium sp. JV274]